MFDCMSQSLGNINAIRAKVAAGRIREPDDLAFSFRQKLGGMCTDVAEPLDRNSSAGRLAAEPARLDELQRRRRGDRL